MSTPLYDSLFHTTIKPVRNEKWREKFGDSTENNYLCNRICPMV